VRLAWRVELVRFDRPVNWHRAELDEMLAEATARKEEGNALLRDGAFELAREKYEKTARDLDGLRGLSEEAHARVSRVLAATRLNLALCHQRLGEHARALETLAKVLEADPACVKALWRRSVSRLATHEYEGARADLEEAARLDPSLGEECDAQVARVRRREAEGRAKEKRDLGNVLGKRA
jgi:tetratricopeptide (TPR) repeat protein